MMNMDQNKLMQVINHFVINKYMQNVCIVKSRVLKLYHCFPQTGLVNVSQSLSIAMIEDLDSFIASNYKASNN